ncbi:MAG: hypothetical protein GX158_08180 [Bacteroidales bacterium]|jgi:hypothetical protein|nr:hypothetical protein [Bacteroidales bacterium]
MKKLRNPGEKFNGISGFSRGQDYLSRAQQKQYVMADPSGFFPDKVPYIIYGFMLQDEAAAISGYDPEIAGHGILRKKRTAAPGKF